MKALAAVIVLALAFPAQATARVVAAVPGSAQARTFATRVVPMQGATWLTLHNTDAAFHGIRSEAIGSDEASWCGPLNPGAEGPNNPRRFPRGACPLFWSDLALALGGARPVLGIESLLPGRAYGFICYVHPSMQGALLT
ncbi:MAG TPA: hypothetical protein VM841_05245 [Actinomycetota bacterium]|nr:hypothetical protein [Actinomycetota bacterium]